MQRMTIDYAGVGERIIRLRTAMGYDEQFRWAHAVGISPEVACQVERGKPLSRAVAHQLVQRIPGLSLGWLYYGRSEGLSVEMARTLGELPPLPSMPGVPVSK